MIIGTISLFLYIEGPLMGGIGLHERGLGLM